MGTATAVYKITNSVNGKLYIGISANPDKRWWEHRNQTRKTHTRLYNAFRKYGVEAFTFEILCWCDTREDARELENLAVEVCDTIATGYNMCPGGGGGIAGPDNPAYGKSLPIEVRTKMSAAAKARPVDKKHMQNMRQVLQDKFNDPEWVRAKYEKVSTARKGRPHTEEHKKKLCKAWERRKERNEPVHNAKRVVCLQTGEVFDSASAAARHFGFSPSALHKHLHGRQQAVKGFTFRWYTMEPEEKGQENPIEFTLNSVSVVADRVEPDIEISEEV